MYYRITRDVSGIIKDTGVSQIVMSHNTARVGYFIQNLGNTPIYINELGQEASSNVSPGIGSILLGPRETWPMNGIPVTSFEISVAGTKGCAFAAREW